MATTAAEITRILDRPQCPGIETRRRASAEIISYVEVGGTRENARTTKLYDRTGDEITLDEVERITI